MDFLVGANRIYETPNGLEVEVRSLDFPDSVRFYADVDMSDRIGVAQWIGDNMIVSWNAGDLEPTGDNLLHRIKPADCAYVATRWLTDEFGAPSDVDFPSG